MTPPVNSALWFATSFPLRMFLRAPRSWDQLNVWADGRGWCHERLVDCVCWLESMGYATGDEHGWVGTVELPWAPDWLRAAGACQEGLPGVETHVRVPEEPKRHGAPLARQQTAILSLGVQAQTGMGW